MKMGNQKNTNLDQNSSTQILKKTYFDSAKMAPPKVDKLITFELATLITLERPKGGQTNNSPAYIYICMADYFGEVVSVPLFSLFKS